MRRSIGVNARSTEKKKKRAFLFQNHTRNPKEALKLPPKRASIKEAGSGEAHETLPYIPAYKIEGIFSKHETEGEGTEGRSNGCRMSSGHTPRHPRAAR